MFEAGTRVIAENVRIVIGFADDLKPVYGRSTVEGRIVARPATKFVAFDAEGKSISEPAPRKPAMDQTGHYWVKSGPPMIHRMFHESELRRDTSAVFVRPVLEAVK